MKILKQKTYGFSLIEIVLVLIAVLSITILTFSGYKKISSYMRVETEVKNLQYIYSETVSNFNNTRYVNLNTNLAVDHKVFPENMYFGTNSSGRSVPENVYSGYVKVEETKGTEEKHLFSFNIIYPNVPNKDCIDIINGVSNVFYKIGVDSTGGSGGSGSKAGKIVKSDSKKLNTSDLIKQCSSIYDRNTITFFGN